MAQLVIHDFEEDLLVSLQARATNHGRTVEAEAKAILVRNLSGLHAKTWDRADLIYQRLAQTGRSFSDSVELIREDRQR